MRGPIVADFDGPRSRPRTELFGGVFGFDDRAAHVVAAIRADHMRRNRGAALRAIMQLLRLLLIVGPTGTGTGITLTTLWYGHDNHRDGTATLGETNEFRGAGPGCQGGKRPRFTREIPENVGNCRVLTGCFALSAWG